MPRKPSYYDKHGRLGILTIDDDQVNLMVMESLLKPLGFEVITATDGMETYAIVDQEDTWPDIVFLDYNLEYGDSGEMVLKKLLERFGGQGPPILMCTAMSAGSSILDKCLQLGAAGIMLKPYDRNNVVASLEKHCSAKMAPKPSSAAAPAPAPDLPSALSAAPQAGPTLEQLCVDIGLEYVGKKLGEGGYTLKDIAAMDDTTLRKAGVVVKSQRDKLLEAVRALRP